MKTPYYAMGLFVFATFLPTSLQAQEEGDCTVYNNSWTSPTQNRSDETGHETGNHSGSGAIKGACTYSGANKAGICETSCGAAGYTEQSDTGQIEDTVSLLALMHSTTGKPTYGGAGSNVPGPIAPNPSRLTEYWTWILYPTCAFQWTTVHSPTPIIIDTDGSGFHLTSATGDLLWDFYANHRPIQIAWTQASSTNGWLAMPDSNGQITSARQIFSNVASQGTTDSDEGRNGFRALAAYDTNGDGVIDAKDNPWWVKFRVWIDVNHDGISQPNELHTLESLGITSIALANISSPKTDEFGNQFKLKGKLTGVEGNNVDRVIYDVTLVTANAATDSSSPR